MNKKKLAFVANTAWSMFNFRHGLLSRLICDGYQLTIIAPRDEFSDKLQKMGCAVVDLPMEAKGTNPLQELKLIYTLYRIYQQITPDFIIHYTIKPNVYGSLAAKMAGIPSLAITTGLGYTFVNDNFIAKIARQLYKMAFRYPKEVWFLNEDDRQAFLAYSLVSENKAKLLHGEGVNVSHFSPISSSFGNNPTTFLLIARMLWDKGIGEYIEAARVIKSKYPKTHFQLLGACDVPNPSLISREQIIIWESEGIVEYLGTTDDVRTVIANVDCVVLPSYREGIPRTMLEAAAMAKPLIVSDAPGCKDVVINGKTGFLCKVKNRDSLAAAMELIINQSTQERVDMGGAGRNLVLHKFDERVVIKKYIDMLSRYNLSISGVTIKRKVDSRIDSILS
ncbi:glycosyltransferase family 4 protein [Aeromonas dhakensis]|uniref:glycosyltransferase family 4 protein n=1 Tax=Aeromonas dhakensis TaxID=196024 RepID=UPI00191FEBCF|nr:glycosyltransferase family 4 protein [Aeromonas dhakensis]MBL0460962.1 glycosyltransferase family 4 protein [Aeromonas dhakensis]HDX8339587.1 glycosyltransferase family 4 protein [Aeromonas dhakensis]HDX8614511.1 glycosyltransferase family 4 protein [Aeromonas dhakensis]